LENSLSSMDEASLSSNASSSHAGDTSMKKKKSKSSSGDHKKHNKHSKEDSNSKDHHESHHNSKHNEKSQHHHHHSSKHSDGGGSNQEKPDFNWDPDYHWEEHAKSKSNQNPHKPSSRRSSAKQAQKQLEKLTLGDDDQGLFDAEEDDHIESNRKVIPTMAELNSSLNALQDEFDDGPDEEELDMEEDEALRTTGSSSAATSITSAPSFPTAMTSLPTTTLTDAAPSTASNDRPPMSPVRKPTINSPPHRPGGGAVGRRGSLSPPSTIQQRSLKEAALGIGGPTGIPTSATNASNLEHHSGPFVPPFFGGENDDDDEDGEDADQECGGTMRRTAYGNTLGAAAGNSLLEHNSTDLSAANATADEMVPEAFGVDEGIPKGW